MRHFLLARLLSLYGVVSCLVTCVCLRNANIIYIFSCYWSSLLTGCAHVMGGTEGKPLSGLFEVSPLWPAGTGWKALVLTSGFRHIARYQASAVEGVPSPS